MARARLGMRDPLDLRSLKAEGVKDGGGLNRPLRRLDERRVAGDAVLGGLRVGGVADVVSRREDREQSGDQT